MGTKIKDHERTSSLSMPLVRRDDPPLSSRSLRSSAAAAAAAAAATCARDGGACNLWVYFLKPFMMNRSLVQFASLFMLFVKHNSREKLERFSQSKRSEQTGDRLLLLLLLFAASDFFFSVCNLSFFSLNRDHSLHSVRSVALSTSGRVGGMKSHQQLLRSKRKKK